jgi:short-subunit dehydrogenase
MSNHDEKDSPVALITGASSGLGAIFARQLAEQGYGLLLVARRVERLEALAAEIQSRHNVSVELFPADLSLDTDLDRLEQRISELESLELLVNNAGFSTTGKFANVVPEKHRQMVSVHLMATVRLTRASLPGMLRHHKGGIINVASLAAFFPLIGNSVYCATKSALVAFTLSLAIELDGSGVQVQALCPGFVYTEFHETPENKGIKRSYIPKFMFGQAEPVVTASLKALRRGKVLCIPGGLNKFLSIFGRNQVFLPAVMFALKRASRKI